MRAAILFEIGDPLRVENVEVDPPGPGEVAVRMAASGVCHSDLHVVDGIHDAPRPVILGHEGAGVVEEVGPGVSGLTPGDHVILSWLPHCGRCRFCVSGRPNICENLAWSDAGLMMDGTTRFHRGGERIHHFTTSSFAERSVVPAQTAVRIDSDLPLTEMALMGCAVMTAVGAVVNTARVRPGDTVAVVGCGGVGLNIVQAAAIAAAAEIVAVDANPQKLELARELGATRTCSPEEAAASVRVDHSFEAVGLEATIDLAVGLPGRGGQAILVGMAAPAARPRFEALALTMEEKAIRGCWYGSCRPHADFPMLVALYRAGRLRLEPLIETCGLEDVNAAFERMRRGEAARSVIVY
ncbi:MAG TPA: alcohol dehydrogenase catalytic domain-containing protein [Gaiellales bacterium]|nr:alcohol dehydrogenase catalytic domain-containing protein [Gaiellales bacterium]